MIDLFLVSFLKHFLMSEEFVEYYPFLSFNLLVWFQSLVNHANILHNVLLKNLHDIYALCIMPCSRSGPENESYQNKGGGLTLNLFLQFCALLHVNIMLKNI